MRVRSPVLGNTFALPGRGGRVVSLVSSATEALCAIGGSADVVGVSPYCARYVPGLAAPVVGDYVEADPEVVRAARPDLVLVCDGVQLPLARRLAAAGLPTYLLPVPQSRHGILENLVAVGALTGRLREARALAAELEAGAVDLLAAAPDPRPPVYAELWFGAHPRRAGGRSFVHDLVELAGGASVLADAPFGYAPLDHADVEARLDAAAPAAPWLVLFQEPEHPVDARRLLAERGWEARFGERVIHSTVARGENLIHDGPSFLETARWLRRALRGG